MIEVLLQVPSKLVNDHLLAMMGKARTWEEGDDHCFLKKFPKVSEARTFVVLSMLRLDLRECMRVGGQNYPFSCLSEWVGDMSRGQWSVNVPDRFRYKLLSGGSLDIPDVVRGWSSLVKRAALLELGDVTPVRKVVARIPVLRPDASTLGSRWRRTPTNSPGC